jgi:hypothetical protein
VLPNDPAQLPPPQLLFARFFFPIK